MRLAYKDRNEKRRKIKDFLQNNTLADGQLYHFSKEELEELLFETSIYERDNKKIIVKSLVWSGPFLRKVDLSEVSFDNVDWDVSYLGEFFKKKYQFISTIDLSGTNAKIDFSKSFNALIGKPVVLTRCNLANVDLSESHGEYIASIMSCDLSTTNIKLDLYLKTFDEKDCVYYIRNSNLENIDLKRYEISINCFNETFEFIYISPSTNLANTGINICTRPLAAKKENYLILKEMLKTNRWQNCFINGKRILSLEEIEQRRIENLTRYNQFVEDNIKVSIKRLRKQ